MLELNASRITRSIEVMHVYVGRYDIIITNNYKVVYYKMS